MIRSKPSPHLLTAAEALLDRHAIASPREITPLRGGRGNRLFRVKSSEGRFLLKQYFRSARQPRDRLAAEFEFCQFLHRAGLRRAPEPIACDEREGLALYEYIDGRPFRRGEVGEREIEVAIDFVREINMYRHQADAHGLATADEAAFSVAEHLRLVDRRVQHLHAIDPTNPSQDAAKRFAHQELDAAWKQTAESIERECARIGIDPDASLTADRRVLSPTDFGFHNALRTRDGSIRFLNFESAGWDDPARLIGDFFFRPALPVPSRYLEAFRTKVFLDLGNRQFEIRRSEMLSPLFRTKWCCFILENLLADAQLQKSLFEAGSDVLAWVNPLTAARLILNRANPQPPAQPAPARS